MTHLHTVGRIAVLAIVAAGIAVVLFFVAVYIVAIQIKSPIQPGNVVPTFTMGHVELTPAAPVSVQRFTVVVEPYGDDPTARVDVDVALPGMGDVVSVSVTRSSDGRAMTLGPSVTVDEKGGIGGRFEPFTSCGPTDVCRETFSITFALTGSESVSADWYVYLVATYTKPVQTDEGVRVTIER